MIMVLILLPGACCGFLCRPLTGLLELLPLIQRVDRSALTKPHALLMAVFAVLGARVLVLKGR